MESSRHPKPDLPAAWRWAKLGEVCTFTNGDAYRESDWSGAGTPIIRIQNLNDASKPFNYWEGSLDDRVQVRNGDLLLAWSGTPGTSFGAHIWGRGMGLLNQHIFLVQFPHDVLDARWASHAINHVLGNLIRAAHGAVGLAHVTRRQVDALEIPLPPLFEQQRIAGILGEEIAAVVKARAAARDRLDIVKKLPASFLRQTFPGPGQPLPADWRWARLGEVSEINPSRSDSDRGGSEPTSFVPMEAVDARRGAICGMKERPFCEVNKGYTYVREGDVMFAKITPCMQNGKHAIATGLIGGFGFASTEFHVISPTSEVLAEWIHHFVRQPIVLQKAANHFTGAVGQQRVPEDYLKRLCIPIPPVDEQRRIAAALRDRLAKVETARVAAEEEIQTISALPAALLRRAFKGDV